MGKRCILTFVCCAFMVMLFASTSISAEKVGYINLQRLVNESKMGQAARADIQKMRAGKEAEVNKKLKDINQLKEDINKNREKMKITERRAQKKTL